MKLLRLLLDRLRPARPPARTFPLDAPTLALVDDLARAENRPAGEVASDLLAAGVAQVQSHKELVRRWGLLTVREQDVTALACLGYTNRQIASRLGISPETVKTHFANASSKFELHGKAEFRRVLGYWDFSEWGRK